MDEIAVLIPCFNEEITVGKVVRDFKRALPQATVYVLSMITILLTKQWKKQKKQVQLLDMSISKEKGTLCEECFRR